MSNWFTLQMSDISVSQQPRFLSFHTDREQSGCIGSPQKQPLLVLLGQISWKSRNSPLAVAPLSLSPTQKVIIPWNKQLFSRLTSASC